MSKLNRTPDSTVRKRIQLGLSANAYSTGISGLVHLAGVPILLQAWGTQLYGEWLVLFAIPAYLSMANLGYSLSIANDMTALTARDDRGGALMAFQSLIALISVTALTMAVIVGVVVTVVPVAGWLHLTGLSASTIRWVLLLLAGEILIQLFGGVSSAGYRATREYGLGATLDATVILLQSVAIWIAALAGFGIVGAAAAFLCVRVAGTLVTTGVLIHRHPWLRIGFRQARLRYIRNLLSPSFASLMLPISNALKNQGLLLVVNALLGPIAVVVFSVLRTLTRLSLRLVSIVSHSIEPEVASAEGSRDRDLQRRLYLAGLRGSWWLSILIGIALYFIGNTILRVWTHGQVPMDKTLFIWLLAASAISAIWLVPLTMLQAMNRHQRAALAYVLGGIIAVAVAWILVRATGNIAGAGVALLIGDGFFAVYVLVAVARITQTPLGATLSSIMNPSALFHGQSFFSIPERFMNTLRRTFR